MGRVAIVGAGWLGEPLARALLARGEAVVATTTDPSKQARLAGEGIETHLLHADEVGEWPLGQCDALVITLPPSRVADYPQAIARLCAQARQHGVTRLLLIGATSVYRPGQSEEDTPAGDGERALRLLRAEQVARGSGIAQVVVLRAAGLYGPGRHPGRFLAGRECHGGAQAVNLVHLDDVVAACILLLESAARRFAYVVSAPVHPCRADFYEQAARVLSLAPPRFVAPQGEYLPLSGKALCDELGFVYRWPDPLAWLGHDAVCQGE